MVDQLNGFIDELLAKFHGKGFIPVVFPEDICRFGYENIRTGHPVGVGNKRLHEPLLRAV